MLKSRVQPKHVQDYAGAGDTIVLLHGFLASKRYWHKIIPLLRKEGYRVVTLDLLGFGASPKPKDAAYSYSDHLKHIETTLNELGISSRIAIAGHSMGALLALRYARTRPERVKSICLLNPPMYLNAEQAASTLLETGKLYRFLLDSPLRHIAWIALRNISPLASHTRHSRERSLKNIIMQTSFFNDLADTAQPTLLLLGKRDRPIYQRNLRDVSLRSNIHIAKEESGHHGAITHSTAIGQLLIEFLESKKT